MSAAPYNFEIDQYLPFSKEFVYRDSAKNPINLTGYAAKMQIRLPTGSLVQEMSTDNGGITLGGIDGTIGWHISKADTSKMSFAKAVYDLVLTPPVGDAFKLIAGEVVLVRGSTR